MRKFFTRFFLLVSSVAFAQLLSAQTNPVPQSLPFTQNFSTFTGSTTTFPAGFQGWGTGSSSLSASYFTAVSTADQALTSQTNASNTGYVADIAGKMGLMSTGSNMKQICLAINTTSKTGVSVSYTAATQRQEVGARTNALGLQYRVGTSGAFTTITASEYQNNLALGSNITGTGSVNPVTVNITLPAACDNQPVVQLRWLIRDVSGSGNRPSFSIDDISIDGTSSTPTTTGISPNTVSAGGSAFTLTVNGTGFINGASTVTWGGSARATTFVSATQLTAAIPASDITTPGTVQVGVTTTGAPAASNTQTFTINPAATPSVLITSALAGFGNVCLNNSSVHSFTFNGSDLDGSNIVIGALNGFGYSLNAGGPFSSALSIAYSGNGFTGKTVYVQFLPAAVQSYNGNISITGGGLAGGSIVASGAGINTPATVATGANVVAGTAATLNGSISDNGCSTIGSYGFEYSTTSNFTNGTGTQVIASNLSGNNFSSTVTGLTAGVTYYYKAFATNTGGTAYGNQGSFTPSAVMPVVMSAQPLFRYTENFNDVNNWSNNFVTGIGANHFSSVDITNSTGIPNATKITTSSAAFTTSTTGGVQKGTGNLVLFTTGTGDNTTAVAVDFYMDFTGMNAGTVSFDWATINNSFATGNNRTGSLRVYASVDGVNFTELAAADVLNFVNGVPATGTVNSLALPAIFNNSATARLRFYYHNGTGGSSGSRPKISIDNLTVTGVPSSPCVAPSAGPTALSFGTIGETSIQGSFTAASPASDEYLVIVSTNNSLTSNPIDGQVYNVGDNVGDGDVIAKGNSLNFTAPDLDGSTTYYFFIFPLNSVCTNGPLYSVANVLTGTATTAAGLPPCAAPADQATSFAVVTGGINSIQASFTAGSGNEYLVLQSTSASLSGVPVNGQSYNAGDIIGNAKVVQRSSNTVFTASGLTPATTYYYYIISLNSQACVNGPVYNTVAPLTGVATTQSLPVCAAPTAQPINLVLNASNSNVNGNFNSASGNGSYYLVVRSSSATLSATPVDNNDYAVGTSLGGGTVVANGPGTSFNASGLNATTTYYFFVFAMDKNCSGGTKYLTASPLTGNITTTNTPPNNIYFGTLHSHSDYSDGNKDHPGYTPTDDYNYALGSQHMDFLGISEHNHFSSLDNPGDEIAKYHSGVTEAANFNATHTGFLALYGMEWGVISGGGHVVVYGDGMGDLFGWESNVNGNVGPNYDVYVPKSVYTGPTGLFKTVNDYVGKNAFATLAHPNSSDYNNLANIPYDAQSDSAITGSAVESGPATSTNTSYSNPASPMSYLWYFQKMLSKGYHLGPTIDHDNHNTTFGRTTKARTAVIAPSLTQTDIIKAVRDMHFYATEDYDTKVDFTVNNRIMGSIFEDLNAPSISVNVTDATDDYSGALIRVMYGVPGSNVLPVVVDSVFGSSLSFIDNNLPNNTTGYYYIDITKGSTRTVTSPIWYTRKCAISTEFSITACGSYSWNGTLYTTSVSDTKTFTTTGGCDSTVTMHLTIQSNVTNINTGSGFCTIQAAINDPQTLPGHTLEVQPGTYNEQILVNKGVTIKGVGATQPVVDFNGTVAGKRTVFDVSVANATIDNLNIKVDLSKLSSGIIASGSSVSNLVIRNSKIDAYGSGPAASVGSYSDRNAVSVNYSGATNYRIAGANGVSNISFLNNTVTGVVNDGFGVARYFRSGIAADDASGTFSNNTLQSINHDVIVRFGNSGAVTISNNTFNGGGVELSDFNGGAGALTVASNQFHAAFANTAAANTAVLRLKNNYNGRTTFVTNNTFTDAEWGISMENYNNVTVLNNSFTPLAGSVNYHHVTVNTKAISTNSATIVQKPVSATLNGNTFNGSGANGGTALGFYNHDNDAAAYGIFVIGGPGTENIFNAGIKTFVALDAQSGLSGAATFPNYPSVIGTGAGAVTTMAPWPASLFMVNNQFDAGSGLKLPAAMNNTELFALEDKIQHQIDASPLGFVLVKAGNDYVTTNSSLAPLNTGASIQRGVDAASNGFTVNVGPGVFADNVTVNKSVLVQGAGEANTTVVPAVSNPDCGGAGGGSLCAGGSNVFLVQANNVQIAQLTIDGNNPSISSGTVVDGVDIDARNGIITDHNAGVFNQFTVSHVTVKNIFLRGIYASSGGSFQFNNNTVTNVQGNSSSIGIFNYGGAGQFNNNTVSNTSDAIASNWSKGSTYSGNTVTNSGSGIHTDNNGGSGGNADIIQNNNVSNSKPGGYGIWVFAPYVPSLVRANTVSNVDVGLAAAGQQAAVVPVFERNTVDGQNKPNSTGVYVTTDLFGFGTSDVSAVFQNNFIRNNTDGFYLESETGRTLNLQAHSNSITGNTNASVTQGTGASGAGNFIAGMECNWWGTLTNATIAAGIHGAAVVFNPRLINGVDADPVGAGFQPVPSCANPVSNATVTSQVDVNCYGSATGTATIAFSNGTPGMTYTLDGGSPVSISGSPFTVSGLAGGAHAVVISDVDGNTTTVSFTIAQPAAPISVNYTFTPIACHGGLSTQNLTVYGGTAPYNVLNQGGGAFVTGAAEGVTYGGTQGNTYAASYVYTVTDAKGCQYVFTANITEPPVLTVSASAADIACPGGSTTITVAANGGKAPYTGTGAFNVTAGTYTYTVTDANGCTASVTQTVAVNDTQAPVITAPSNTSLCGNTAGNYSIAPIMATDNCGIASMTYSISGATARAGTGYNASGVFNTGVSVITWKAIDASGNYSTATQTVTVTPAFSIAVTSVPTSNVYTGGIATNLYLGYGAQSTTLQTCSLPSSGAPYTYAWSGSAVGRLSSTSGAAPVFTPATYGSYLFTVTVTNKYGCTSIGYITICVTDVRVPGTGGKKVYVCHQTNGKGKSYQTLEISVNAVPAHLGDGTSNGCGNKDNDDRLGSCDQAPCGYTSTASVSGDTKTQGITQEGTGSQKTVTADDAEAIKVTVMPNPSTTYFTLKFESKSTAPMNLRVMDANGRVVDARSAIVPNTSMQIGRSYSSGTYYAEVMQSGQRKVVQLIKGRG